MIMEILQWLQLLSAKRLWLSQSLNLRASDLILLGYLFALMTNKKCYFIVVFLLCEVLAYSGILNNLSDFMFYMVFASIYSALYHYLFFAKSSIKTIIACGIIVLFNAGAAMDAVFYPQTETILYSNYEAIVVAVHFYLIYTLINWQVLRSVMGASVSWVYRSMGFNYNMPFNDCCLPVSKEERP
jgi:hypothetical protein